MKNFLKILSSPPDFYNSHIHSLFSFNDVVLSCVESIEKRHAVNIVRNKDFLNWRYFKNPRIKYECTGYMNGNDLSAYVVSRHERFFPSNIYATRIIDMCGSPISILTLLRHEILKAYDRGDSFVDFSITSNFYNDVLKDSGFIELIDKFYGALPQVSSPIDYRDNHEFICLGSKNYPNLFKNIRFNDLFFTRGDSDRDRAN